MAVVSVGPAPPVASAGDIFTTSMTVANVYGVARDSVVFNYVLSYDTYFSSDDVVLSSKKADGGDYLLPLAHQMQVSIPPDVVSGNYYLLRSVYAYNYYNDLDPFLGNNTASTPIQILGQNNNTQDLIALNFGRHWDNTVAGDTLYLNFSVKNFGELTAPVSELAFYLSNNPVWDSGDRLMGKANIPTLGPHQEHGMQSSNGGKIYLPIDTWQGAYYLFVKLDNSDLIAESNEDNNLVFKRLYVYNQFNPAALIEAPDAAVAFAGTSARIDFKWKNKTGRDYDELYTGFILSKDRRLDAGDRLLGYAATDHLTKGKSAAQSASVQIPDDVLPGDYWLLFVSSEDAQGYLAQPCLLPPATKLNVKVHPREVINRQSPHHSVVEDRLDIAPNPASGFVCVSFDLEGETAFSMCLFDLGGKEMMTLEEGHRSKGSYQTQFDTSSLSPGVYRIVLRQKERTVSKSIVVH
jgi:hypothetical protein